MQIVSPVLTRFENLYEEFRRENVTFESTEPENVQLEVQGWMVVK